ncbi:MAG: hypothetical protein K2J00_02530 [Bacteroidaceae bacterium]|nr:hypothetical protein [Bacteroidaceae bacterium]
MSKADLKDVTFLLIFRIDTIERLENTLHVVRYLNDNFDSNILLWEYGRWNNNIVRRLLPSNVSYQFNEDFDSVFYRTRFLNNMIDTVKTEYIAVWDVDVIIDKKQIFKTIQLLKDGQDVVYPYDQFLDTTDEIRRIYFHSGGNINILHDCVKYMHELYGSSPVGGAFFIRTDKYIRSGKENEDYYGWGYEDGDRYYRWVNCGYKIDRVHGSLFHLWHPRGLNSSTPNADAAVLKKRCLFSTVKDNNNE